MRVVIEKRPADTIVQLLLTVPYKLVFCIAVQKGAPLTIQFIEKCSTSVWAARLPFPRRRSVTKPLSFACVGLHILFQYPWYLLMSERNLPFLRRETRQKKNSLRICREHASLWLRLIFIALHRIHNGVTDGFRIEFRTGHNVRITMRWRAPLHKLGSVHQRERAPVCVYNTLAGHTLLAAIVVDSSASVNSWSACLPLFPPPFLMPASVFEWTSPAMRHQTEAEGGCAFDEAHMEGIFGTEDNAT